MAPVYYEGVYLAFEPGQARVMIHYQAVLMSVLQLMLIIAWLREIGGVMLP